MTSKYVTYSLFPSQQTSHPTITNTTIIPSTPQSTNITSHRHQHYHDTVHTPISLVSLCLTSICSLYHYSLTLILTLYLFYKCHHMNRNLLHCIPTNEGASSKVLAILELQVLSEIQKVRLSYSVLCFGLTEEVPAPTCFDQPPYAAEC